MREKEKSEAMKRACDEEVIRRERKEAKEYESKVKKLLAEHDKEVRRFTILIYLGKYILYSFIYMKI